MCASLAWLAATTGHWCWSRTMDIDRREVLDMLRQQWPNAVVKELEQNTPTGALSPADAADLGGCRRGVEPLRAVVMPQQDRQINSPVIKSMPLVTCGGVVQMTVCDAPCSPNRHFHGQVYRTQNDRLWLTGGMTARWHLLQRIQQPVGSVTVSSRRRWVGRRRWIADR